MSLGPLVLKGPQSCGPFCLVLVVVVIVVLVVVVVVVLVVVVVVFVVVVVVVVVVVAVVFVVRRVLSRYRSSVCDALCPYVPARFANVFDDMRFSVDQLLCHWSQMHVPGWCDDIINFS